MSTVFLAGSNSIVQVSDDVLCMGFVDGGDSAWTSIVIGGYQLEDSLLEFDLGSDDGNKERIAGRRRRTHQQEGGGGRRRLKTAMEDGGRRTHRTRIWRTATGRRRRMHQQERGGGRRKTATGVTEAEDGAWREEQN
ncbi:hypothetical protein V2J09_016177 [Rumex salicifolius]